jgi:ribosomal protein S12 methylthiotransferase accessory factor
MLDVRSALRTGNGVVQNVSVQPPQDSDPLWTVAVRLDRPELAHRRGLDSTDYPLDLVGACGGERADAMVRAAGEAVERFSLVGPGGLVLAGPETDRRPDWQQALDSTVGSTDMPHYAGRRLIDGSAIAVPAALVDYPYSDDDTFEATPSGAAAGSGCRGALRAALLELIERDAVMVGWSRQLELTGVPVQELIDAPPSEPGTRRQDSIPGALTHLLARCEHLGLAYRFGRIPSAVAGVNTVVCVVMDPGRDGLSSAGCKASGDGLLAVLGALREALQIRTLLSGIREHYADDELPTVVDSDLTRARYLATAAGSGALWAWALRFVPQEWSAQRIPTDELSVDSLIAGLAADGADPLMVDLTPRLPVAVRNGGWTAVKAIAPGYQGLRMDDGRSDGWVPARLNGPVSPLPHPLV